MARLMSDPVRLASSPQHRESDSGLAHSMILGFMLLTVGLLFAQKSER